MDRRSVGPAGDLREFLQRGKTVQTGTSESFPTLPSASAVERPVSRGLLVAPPAKRPPVPSARRGETQSNKLLAENARLSAELARTRSRLAQQTRTLATVQTERVRSEKMLQTLRASQQSTHANVDMKMQNKFIEMLEELALATHRLDQYECARDLLDVGTDGARGLGMLGASEGANRLARLRTSLAEATEVLEKNERRAGGASPAPAAFVADEDDSDSGDAEKEKVDAEMRQAAHALLKIQVGLAMRDQKHGSEVLARCGYMQRLVQRRGQVLQMWRTSRLAEYCAQQMSSRTGPCVLQRHPALPCLPFGLRRYQVLKPLGSGGCGEVHLAYDVHEHRRVAIKIHTLNADWAEVHRNKFLGHVYHEIQIQSQLSHPNVISVHDTFLVDQSGIMFACVQDFADGGDLDTLLTQRRRLSADHAAVVFRQILQGLAYIHTPRTFHLKAAMEDAQDSTMVRSVIHLDLKPANILFTSDGRVCITDFGLSKIAVETADGGDRATLTSPGTGTPGYIPPEAFVGTGLVPAGSPLSASPKQGSAGITTAADMWSAGVVLFRMLFAERPFGDQRAPTQSDIVGAVEARLAVVSSGRSSSHRWSEAEVSEVRALLLGLLNADATCRLTAAEALNSAWIRRYWRSQK